MTLHLLPILFGLFVWWTSTVAIIFLDGLPRRTFKWSLAGATVVLGLSIWGLRAASGRADVTGAYLAFACGVLAWGWQEMSFYMGLVTGPRKQPCPEGCSGWRHFGHAVQTSLWHELAIIASAAIVVAVSWGRPNQIGVWTFLVLWWMHQSAKLNVFLGVRNLNEEFLPEHLAFLKGFLTKKPMNLLFPVSVTVSTVITWWLGARAFAPGATSFAQVGFTFLAAFMALAVLEHWMLVLPMPAGAIWTPGLKSRKAAAKPFDAEVVAGFLGAGKTTFLRRALAEADPAVKTVVLVNDFGELGLDGARLSGQGAEVVELPNGCICCSLKADLGAQLKEVTARLAPDRVLIEPSGVADVAALLAVLHAPDVAPMLRSLKVFTLVDTGAFLSDHARLPKYFEAQAKLSPVVLLSKTDLATPTERRLVEHTVRGLNPRATVAVVRHGALDPAVREVLHATAGQASEPAHEPAQEHDHAHEHEHEHEHAAPALGLASWSGMLGDDPVDLDALEALLELAGAGRFGRAYRAKGSARAAGGWVAFDLAGGRVSLSAYTPAPGETPRIAVIGEALDAPALAAAVARLAPAPLFIAAE